MTGFLLWSHDKLKTALANPTSEGLTNEGHEMKYASYPKSQFINPRLYSSPVPPMWYFHPWSFNVNLESEN